MKGRVVQHTLKDVLGQRAEVEVRQGMYYVPADTGYFKKFNCNSEIFQNCKSIK